VARTCHPTGHSILIRTYIELPSDLTEEESKELTEKLEILHDILDKDVNIFINFFSSAPMSFVVLVSFG
jgi:divalent metal cation (Fe/Co/Zn/Cd) transporter